MTRSRLPEFFRPDEARALIEAAAPRRRDHVIVLCALYLGLRVAELVAVRIEDVDLAEARLLVRLGKGGKDRWLPVKSTLAPVLASWIGERRSGWLFPSPRCPDRPLTTRAVRYLIGRLARRANIHRRASPHVCRHTFATSLLRNGADLTDVQRLLGHSHLQTTSKYLHADTSRLQAAVDRL
jgi:integrase/recombinase XerD